MKILIASALLFFFTVTATHAQNAGASKHHRARTMLKTNKSVNTNSMEMNTTDNGVPVSSAGAEVSGVTGSAPGDPYNLAHPYFNGDARWTHADSLYKHGDFPWAMVQQHPENFRFDAASGQWEVINAPTMGSSKQSR